MNVSTTQVTNYAALAGIVIMIINRAFDVQITNEQGDAIISGILALSGVAMNFWHRYQRGDLKLSGARKEPRV